MARIAILGLGYIGGSIGLGLMKAKLKNTEIIGFDDWRRARRDAEKRKVVDKSVNSVREAVDGAGLVIIATPPAAVEQMLEEMASHLGRGAAVTDVAAAKRVIHSAAADHLPSGVSFVGGHPMAGSAATFGIENADAELFQGTSLVCLHDSHRVRGIGAFGAWDDSRARRGAGVPQRGGARLHDGRGQPPAAGRLECALHDAARQRGLDGLRARGSGHVQDDDGVQLRRPQHRPPRP